MWTGFKSTNGEEDINGKYSIDDIAKMPNQLNIKIFDNDGNLSSIEDPITEATSNFTTDVQAFINTNDINPAATIACADAEGASATASGLELGLYIIVETGTTLKENGLVVLEEVCPLSARMIVNPVSMRMENERINELITNLRNLLQEEKNAN